MKNSMGEEFTPQRKKISFTPLHGKNLRCNGCGEKVTRGGINGHESHHIPKKVGDQVININKKVNVILK